MDWTAERPKAKRLLFWQRNKKQNPFPVQNVSDENPKFIGYFTGLSVEVFDEEAIQIIYDNGCYGIGSRTKATPRIFTTINVAKRKCDFSDEFDNRKKSNTVDCDKSNDEPANDQSDFENVVRGLKVPKAVVDFDTEEQANDDLLTAPVPKPILDEFPIEKREKFTESLSLFPEEAFFLHHSLKCLTIIDIFENVELSTSAVLQKFCAIKSNFVTSFVAYQYYRSQNWVIKCGIKYAGDFRKHKYSSLRFLHLTDFKHCCTISCSSLLQRTTIFSRQLHRAGAGVHRKPQLIGHQRHARALSLGRNL